MLGGSVRTAVHLQSALWALISVLTFVPLVAGDIAADLENALADKANMTIYRSLIKQHPDIFKNVSGEVTFLAPNDAAFAKVQAWNSKNATMVETLLKIGSLQGSVSMGSIKDGASIFAPTLMDDPSYSNVTGGQNVIITHQPGDIYVVTSGVAARSTILETDVAFDSGLIQIVDSLLVVPARLETTARDAYTDLTSFVGALYATDLIAEFADTPNITLFIPRNAAFQQLAGTFSNMATEDLRKVLRYHMATKMVVHSEDLLNGTKVTMGDGKTIHITRFNNNIYVDSAQMIQTDILIANGVVQMIDNVLNPDNADANPDVTQNTQTPVFPLQGATSTGTAAPTPFASALPCTISCPVTNSPSGSVSAATSKPSSSSNGVPPARCTGLGGAGIGLGVAMGAAGMNYIGLV